MFIQPLCRSWVTIPGPRRAARCPAAKSRGSKPLEPLEVGPPYLAHGRVHSGRRGGPDGVPRCRRAPADQRLGRPSARAPTVSTNVRHPTFRPSDGPAPGAAIARCRGIPDHVTSLLTTDRRTPFGSRQGRRSAAVQRPGPERRSGSPRRQRPAESPSQSGNKGGREGAKKLTPRNRNWDSQVCIRVRPQIERKLPYEFTQGLYGEESRQDFEGGAKWNFADRLLLSEVTCFGG